jgi:hypothetical protein
MTAVEWLKQKTSDITIDKTNYIISEWQDGYNVALEDVIKLLNQALEMEKQQIIDAHVYGHNAPSSTLKNFDAEEYYNETYKKKQNDSSRIFN